MIISEEEFDEIESNIDQMEYRIGDHFDPWYPTVEEIKSHIQTFNKSDLMFLLWLTKPGMKLNEEQKKVKKAIHKMLYDPRILKIQ